MTQPRSYPRNHRQRGSHIAIVLLLSLASLCPLTAAEVGTIRDHIFERLNDAREYLEDDEPSEARRLTERLLTFENTPYEQASIQQVLGYICLEMEDYSAAIEQFEAAVSAKQLPGATAQPMLYNLAQLYHHQERWKDCIRSLETWLRTEPEPSVDAFLIGANAAIQLKDFPQAISYIQQAIQRSSAPVESHYQLWLSALIQMEDWPAAANLLQTIIATFPEKPDYWIQLTSVYLQMEQPENATATLRIAAAGNQLEKPNQLDLLVSLLAGQKVPQRAGEWLQSAIDQAIILPSFKMWSKLGELWLAAREYDAARHAFQNALKEQDDLGLRIRLAQLDFAEQKFTAVVEQLEAMPESPENDQYGKALMLLGASLVEIDQQEKALSIFKKAQALPDTQKDARMWLEYLSEPESD
ncbi:hypothetical protein QEH52_18290 [Coraliomargarita sp. SDUM461003]|uniref:Tetratricopeptide repeat protein n=1 Tax=Thalassobacterium maritimum TaxID=3041265 RepID=A0ABU1AZH9_9BACT|nr:hypothetical protein [Coraliomargarita sp. SDUM461003]MDQ8209481.1 hypothetical protein [Coraliomargarita sp. SDUM461003]